MNPAPTTPRRIADVVLIVVFLAGLFLPLADSIVHLDHTRPLHENRKLAPLPPFEWSFASIRRYPSRFESYYNDHFGFRNLLVQDFYRFKVDWLGVSPMMPGALAATAVSGGKVHGKVASPYPRVVIGGKGWLFYGEEGAVEDYRGTRVFNSAELAHWTKTLAERDRWCRGHGIKYVVFFAPNKATIYPEFMPPAIRKVSDRSGLDGLYEYVKTHSRVDLIDVRDAIRAEKKDYRVYEKTGTHWNQFGAYFACAKIMNHMSGDFPAMRPHPLSDFAIRSRQSPKDLAVMMGMANEMPETVLELEPKFTRRAKRIAPVPIPTANGAKPSLVFETDNATFPRVLTFNDSFGVAMSTLLAEHCSRLAMYRQVDFTPEIIDAEKPDIIIQEMVERTAMGFLPDNFPSVKRYRVPR